MRDDGGSVFPTAWRNDGDKLVFAPNGQVVAPGDFVELPGLTIRDYLAAKAMQGMIASKSLSPSDLIAFYAYSQADEMLKARDA
jgi:hypothetical protein